MARKLFGKTEPRIWTKPLRELTPETSLGFEVIAFALEVLGVRLRPWQEWLLIHALELREDGTYRFQRVIVLVARQNGKTLVASVLAAWWLFVDSVRHPDRVPPVKFKIVGVAQNLDIAREPWLGVKTWCDPDPETEEEAELTIPMLRGATAKVLDANGKEGIWASSRAHYEVRAAESVRGKPTPRVLMDELREQRKWAAWSAVSHTLKSFGGFGQLWAFSNAGDAGAVVLRAQRDKGIAEVEAWKRYVEAGLKSAEEYANEHDTSFGIFEWSAPDGCSLDDVDAVLQANPSIGYGEMTVQSVMAARPPGSPESEYRTEVLCQWVTARIEPHIEPTLWAERIDPDSVIADDSSLGVAVDVSHDRKWAHIAVAGYREDGRIHCEVVASRAGMMWAPSAIARLCEAQGVSGVALQARGTPAGELIDPLEDLGVEVLEITGATALGAVPGRLLELVETDGLRHRDQPLVSLAVAGGVVKRLGEVRVWDRTGSAVDVSPLVALSEAIWALAHVVEVEEPPPPPPASVVVNLDSSDGLGPDGLGLVNLQTAAF